MCPIIAAWYLHRFFVCELLSGLHTRFYYETETSFLSPSLLDYKSREWHESVKAWRKAFQRLAYWLLSIANDIIHFKVWLHVEQKTFEDKCRNSRRCHGGNKTGRSKIKYHSGWKWAKNVINCHPFVLRISIIDFFLASHSHFLKVGTPFFL